MRAPEQRRLRRTWPQRLLISFNIVVVVVCRIGAGGLAWAYSKVHDIQRVDLGTALTPAPEKATGAPVNFLIVGVDSGEGLDPDDPAGHGRPGGLRSDVVMIVRIDPSQSTAAILSFPRDLYVSIAGTSRRDRINTAIQGGPDRLVATIAENFDIEVNHYIQVDFAGFESVVRAVDGLPLYFENPVRDLKSSLEVTETGCVTLDPSQALAFARSRAYQERVNGSWRTDGTGDFGRISRQQLLIRKVVQRAIDKGARNPVVLNQLVDAGIAAVNLDPTLTPGDLLDLGGRFRDFSPETLLTYAVPGASASVGGASVVKINAAAAEPILALFRASAPSNTLSAITVRVVNGTGRADQAATATDDLREAGFTIAAEPPGEADRFDHPTTEVWYAPGFEADAQTVASVLIGGGKVVPAPEAIDEPVRVVTGDDYRGADPTRAGTSIPTPPTSDPQGSTGSPSNIEVPTTSTTIGMVPETPEGVRC